MPWYASSWRRVLDLQIVERVGANRHVLGGGRRAIVLSADEGGASEGRALFEAPSAAAHGPRELLRFAVGRARSRRCGHLEIFGRGLVMTDVDF